VPAIVAGAADRNSAATLAERVTGYGGVDQRVGVEGVH
jgi:hypothetical protein